MLKKYTIPANLEMVNYIQKAAYETNAKKAIIDFMFDSHKMDTDDSLFQSVPFKKYMKEYEESNTEFELIKDRYSKELQKIIDEKEGRENVIFNWRIEDYELDVITIEILG